MPHPGDLILACRMLEDEVALAMKNSDCTLPVVWLERGLHENPAKLRKELLRQIEKHAEAAVILLTFSLCGNAMIGVGSGTSRLVIPRFHDCIQMGLSLEQGKEPLMDIYTFYVTRGWLRGDSSIMASLKRTSLKYGRERALRIYREGIYKNYQSVTTLDTGAYPLEEIRVEAEVLADELDLCLKSCPGSIRILEKLFTGKWDDEFCIVEPGSSFA
ncbi:MAG: DUF1638 domain-containing protein [Treponema sp.]|jgi:hypothetical protein|nr:DUF1638 domain-containing protein [Treponema sp.]